MVDFGPSCRVSLVELGTIWWGGLSNIMILASILGLFVGFGLGLGVGIFSKFSLFLALMDSKISIRFLVLGTLEDRSFDVGLGL